jgi:fructokinase
VSLGEILIDLTEIGTTEDAAPIYAAYPGGAPANLAVAAARLGTDAAFIVKVGYDPFGDQLRRTLQESGVDTSFLYTDQTAFTTVTRVEFDASGRKHYHFFRTPGADTMLTQEEAMAGLVGRPKILHFGSVSLTREPAKSAVLSAVATAHRLGALISFAPNYREDLWSSDADAGYIIQRVLPMCDIIRLNTREFELLTGTTDLDKGTEIISSSYGILLVLVTLGQQGSYYRYRGKTGMVPAFPCNCIDGNGAGESYMGAFLSRLVKEDREGSIPIETLEDMMRFAGKAAAITCSRRGAMPAMPTLEEVEALR